MMKAQDIALAATAAANAEPAMYYNPDKPFYERLLNLLLVGLDVVMVFDGPNKLSKTRDKGHGNLGNRQRHLQTDFMDVCRWLGVQTVIAYAEGEAQCAKLQIEGSVDFVVSEDSDCLIYGATRVLRRVKPRAGNSNLANVKTLDQIMTVTDLEPTKDDLSARTNGNISRSVPSAMTLHGKDGFILLALLTGGDHHLGISKIGPTIAARVCFPPERYATPFLDIFRRSAQPYSPAITSANQRLGTMTTSRTNSSNVYFKLSDDDDLALGSIIDNLFQELKHGREEEKEEENNPVDALNDTEDDGSDCFIPSASTRSTDNRPRQHYKNLPAKKVRRSGKMGSALDGNLFANFPDHPTLYYYLYNNKSRKQTHLPPGTTAEEFTEKRRRDWWYRRAPAMPELLKYWHESNWNIAPYMSKLIFNWYCCGRHHNAATALQTMLDNDAICVRKALSTTTEGGSGNGDGAARIDDDNVQLRLTTTSKQFNAQPIPPKYKVRVMSPLQFLRGYISAAAPQFSLDQFVNTLHMGNVYLEEQPRANIDKEQPQRRPQHPPARPRGKVRFGGTAAGALRDSSSVAANDARLATKLTQPYEFEITRESVDAAPTRFAQRLVEHMHARAAAKEPLRRRAKRQPSGGGNSSGAVRSADRMGSTGHGNMTAILQNMSAPTQSNSCSTPAEATAAAAKILDMSSPVVAKGFGKGEIKSAAICALLESSEEDEPAPPRKRRLVAGLLARQATVSVAYDDTLAPVRAEKTKSASAGKTASTGSMSRYYKIDSFFAAASPTRSFNTAVPTPPPGVASEYEVILIRSSDDDDYNMAYNHDTGHELRPSGGSNNDDCEIVVEPLQSSASADPRGPALAYGCAVPVTTATTTTTTSTTSTAAAIRFIASPPAVILDETDDDATKTDVDSDIEIIELC
jgi:5'-3' exonuclease